MVLVFTVIFIITVLISWMWANGIDKESQYIKDNPDHNPSEGWLDWDESHTEGEI